MTDPAWHGEPPTHLTSPWLDGFGVRCAMTTRHHPPVRPSPAAGGPALAALAIDPAALRWVRQVHGTACLSADQGPPGTLGAADALATSIPGRPLAVFTADCLPVVLVDPGAPALALVHAGWRGTVAGILGHAVSWLGGLGARPERLRVLIGPSIGPCCYEVDGAVLLPLGQAFGDQVAAWLRPAAPGRPSGRRRLDLWQASVDQLVRAGVPAGSVRHLGLCTACHPGIFPSYRREGPGGSLATLARLDLG